MCGNSSWFPSIIDVFFPPADPPLPKPTTPSVQRTTPDTQREGQAWEESEDPLPMTRTDTLKMQTKESKLPFGKKTNSLYEISYI